MSLASEDRDTTILYAQDNAGHVIRCNNVHNLEIEGLTIEAAIHILPPEGAFTVPAAAL